MKAHDIASKAAELVGGDRAATHGDVVENHQRIADIWSAIIQHKLDAHDVANMMEAMKIARRYTGKFNLDDYIDGAGYAAVAGEIKARLSTQQAPE